MSEDRIPEMSIVIGTRHRPDAYRRFLQSFLDSVTVLTEVIVLDASDERTYTLEDPPASTLGPDVLGELVIHHEKPRLGTIRGYNVGFGFAHGRYVTWFNDDVELERGWDKIAVDYMDAHPEIGIGAVYFKDRCGESWQNHYAIQHWQGMQYANFGVVRREWGNEIGWFDERTGAKMYGCDNSICLNMLAAGHAVVPIPGCKCKHWRTLDEDRRLNNIDAEEDGRKLGVFWRGDYSVPKAVYDSFAYLHQPDAID